MVAAAKRLELMGKAGNLAGAAEALGELEEELARLRGFTEQPDWAEG